MKGERKRAREIQNKIMGISSTGLFSKGSKCGKQLISQHLADRGEIQGSMEVRGLMLFVYMRACVCVWGGKWRIVGKVSYRC